MYILIGNGEIFEGTIEEFENSFGGLNQVTDGTTEGKLAWIKDWAEYDIDSTFELSPILSEVAQKHQKMMKKTNKELN